MSRNRWICKAVSLVVAVAAAGLAGCGWRGVNSLALPGTGGHGPGSYAVQAQLPDVTNIQPNSRVRVGDVTVGNVTKIERQGWHALVTMTISGDVHLPANATAKVGQTSLLGALHIELAPPTDTAPQGALHNGSVIPLLRAGAYPTTEETLSVLSMLLNGGGLGQIQDITKAFSTALTGREEDLRNLIRRLDEFIGRLNDQKHDIIAATDSLNHLVGQFAEQKPVLDNALRTIPDGLATLKDQRDNLAEAFDQLGKLSALGADSVNQTKQALTQELKDVGPVLESLANAGPDLTRSLSMLITPPWPLETIRNWLRGDAGNTSLTFDFTLSRIDNALFTGTRYEGNLTQLEMYWGRTIGQVPSPATNGNPLTLPYHLDQGP